MPTSVSTVTYVVAALLFILATLLFRLYVQNFGAYNKTYGTIGAVIMLLTWMYVVSVVERLPLDQRRTLFVLKAGDEYLLVGGGEVCVASKGGKLGRPEQPARRSAINRTWMSFFIMRPLRPSKPAQGLSTVQCVSETSVRETTERPNTRCVAVEATNWYWNQASS